MKQSTLFTIAIAMLVAFVFTSCDKENDINMSEAQSLSGTCKTITADKDYTNDIPVNCGTKIESKGYHSTIRTINVKEPKGKLTIGFASFYIGDEMIVYKGKASEISDDKIIFRTDGFIKTNWKTFSFDYDTPDGFITVRINGGDNFKTQWYFMVFCPTPPKQTKTTTK